MIEESPTVKPDLIQKAGLENKGSKIPPSAPFMRVTMRKRAATTVAAIALLVIAIILGNAKGYYILEGSGADLLWNDHEAYLFLKVAQFGYRLTNFEYLLEIVREYFWVAPTPNDRSSSIVVLRITPNALQRYVFEKRDLTFDTLLNGSIFAIGEGTLWKWDGTTFVPATPEEKQRIDGIKSLSAANFKDTDGWLKRVSILSRTQDVVDFPLHIDGKDLTVRVKPGFAKSSASVDLLRPDSRPEQIWYQNQKAHRVSRQEYEKMFGRS